MGRRLGLCAGGLVNSGNGRAVPRIRPGCRVMASQAATTGLRPLWVVSPCWLGTRKRTFGQRPLSGRDNCRFRGVSRPGGQRISRHGKGSSDTLPNHHCPRRCNPCRILCHQRQPHALRKFEVGRVPRGEAMRSAVSGSMVIGKSARIPPEGLYIAVYGLTADSGGLSNETWPHKQVLGSSGSP